MVNTVFEFKEASVLYEASGSAGTVDIYTDMPTWASRQTISLPVTSGGRTAVVKTLAFSGIAYRVKLQAGAGTSDVLKPYEMSMKVRRIGLYLQAGDSWQTGDIAISL